jgi:hypothetical protein
MALVAGYLVRKIVAGDIAPAARGTAVVGVTLDP